MRTISSGLMYQTSASRVNNIVSNVPKPLLSSCRDRWVSDFPIPAAIRCRRAPASSLERIEDLTLDPAVARPNVASGGDDLAAFVCRSTLDAYASSDRLAELAKDRSR
jgi:hypothetical protein